MLTLSAATDDVDPETIQTILKFFARTGKSWSGTMTIILIIGLIVFRVRKLSFGGELLEQRARSKIRNESNRVLM